MSELDVNAAEINEHRALWLGALYASDATEAARQELAVNELLEQRTRLQREPEPA